MTQNLPISSAPPRLRGCGCGGNSCASLLRPLAELSGVMADMARGLFSGDSYNPRQAAFYAIRAGAAIAEGAGQALSGNSRARWQELTNKLSAYRLFASADRFLPPGGDLRATLHSLAGIDAYRRLWIIEGLGWYWADRRRTGRGALFDQGLPRCALVPLHTGAGLALAQAALESADRTAAVEQFREDCVRLSMTGYRDATFEALGLVAVNLYPELLDEIERELVREEEVSLFWHGAGRGVYFSPPGLVPLPGTRRRTFDSTYAFPQSSNGRQNVAAGYGWATALVNIRQPAVLECCRRDLGPAGAMPDFASGVAAALAVWQGVSPDEPLPQPWMDFAEAREANQIFHRAASGDAWGESFISARRLTGDRMPTDEADLKSEFAPAAATTEEQQTDARVIADIPKYLSRGLDLKRWWDQVEHEGGPPAQFPLVRSFNQPTRAYGFYGEASVDGSMMPVMGNVQEMFYDQSRAPAALNRQTAEWLKEQLREFVMKYFMRVSSFRLTSAYADPAQPTPPPALSLFSWCPDPPPAQSGFGFTQLFYKPIGAAQVYAFPGYEQHAIVDQREIGRTLDWMVTKVRIFDFTFNFRPFGDNGPELVFGENEESYLVVAREFVDYRDEPFQTANGRTVLGEYGIGYSFARSPEPGPFGYGPGEFDAALELIKFRIYDTGYISVRMIFVANRVHEVLRLELNPLDLGLRLAEVASLGIASRWLRPARDLAERSPFKIVFDPVSSYISVVNRLTGDYASRGLCVSIGTLEKLFLLKHFEQHYAAVANSALTWRRIPNWLDQANLPVWVVSGLSE